MQHMLLSGTGHIAVNKREYPILDSATDCFIRHYDYAAGDGNDHPGEYAYSVICVRREL